MTRIPQLVVLLIVSMVSVACSSTATSRRSWDNYSITDYDSGYQLPSTTNSCVDDAPSCTSY